MGEATRDALALIGAMTMVCAGALFGWVLFVSWQDHRGADKAVEKTTQAARDAVESMPLRVIEPLRPYSHLQAVPRPVADPPFSDPSVQALVHTKRFQLLIGGKQRDDQGDGGVPA